MPSPFPGMDPYFEDPAFWEGFHDLFIAEAMFAIERALPPGYISDVRERSRTLSISDEAAAVYVPDIAVARERVQLQRRSTPDTDGGLALAVQPVVIPALEDAVEIKENFIEILKLPDRELVTAVEVLSPWNKLGAGIPEYRGKRQSLLAHGVHVVEIDLLRRGKRTELARALPSGDYYGFVFRADRRPDVEVFGWSLRDALPPIPVPLRGPDADIRLALASVVSEVYDRGRYDRKLRYHLPLKPPAGSEDAGWVAERIATIGRPA